jgi:hypothetical protein
MRNHIELVGHLKSTQPPWVLVLRAGDWSALQASLTREPVLRVVKVEGKNCWLGAMPIMEKTGEHWRHAAPSGTPFHVLLLASRTEKSRHWRAPVVEFSPRS